MARQGGEQAGAAVESAPAPVPASARQQGVAPAQPPVCWVRARRAWGAQVWAQVAAPWSAFVALPVVVQVGRRARIARSTGHPPADRQALAGHIHWARADRTVTRADKARQRPADTSVAGRRPPRPADTSVADRRPPRPADKRARAAGTHYSHPPDRMALARRNHSAPHRDQRRILLAGVGLPRVIALPLPRMQAGGR